MDGRRHFAGQCDFHQRNLLRLATDEFRRTRGRHGQHDLRGFLSHQRGTLLGRFGLLQQHGLQQSSPAGPLQQPKRKRSLPLRNRFRVPEPDLELDQLLGGRGFQANPRAGHDTAHCLVGFAVGRCYQRGYRNCRQRHI